MNGVMVRMFVDSCCSRLIVVREAVKSRTLRKVRVDILMINGEMFECAEVCDIEVNVRGVEITLSCLVEDNLPGWDLIIGIDGIRKQGGVHIRANGDTL